MRGTSILLLCFTNIFFLFPSCKEAEPILPPIPTNINLSNADIYEQLPRGTNVALLSTDVDDPNIRYRLVSGEGDTHNADFEIKTTLVKTKEVLSISDGNTRNIRVQSISPITMIGHLLAQASIIGLYQP